MLAGVLIRAAALPGPGTGDLTVWKVWSYNAARHGVGEMYGVGGTPPERRELEYAGATATVDYPPLALCELGLAGHAYWTWSHRRFPNATPLNAFVKLPSVAAEIGLALLLFALVRARLGVAAARLAAAAYWLNPAALFDASILGYLDAQYVLPAIAALAAAAAGWPALAGALIAAAVLTKAQGLFIAPAVALAIWTTGAPEKRVARLLSAAIAGGLAVTIAIVAPVVAAGGWPNMLQALGRLATPRHAVGQRDEPVVGDRLPAARVRYSMHDMGLWAAITAPAKILGIQRVIEIGYPDPRTIGIVLTVAAIAWALWTARGARDLWLAGGDRRLLRARLRDAVGAGAREPSVRGGAAAGAGGGGTPRLPADRRRRQRGGGAEPESLLWVRRRDRLRAAARDHDHRPHGHRRAVQLSFTFMARGGFEERMLHGSRTPPTASASVAPSTGRP